MANQRKTNQRKTNQRKINRRKTPRNKSNKRRNRARSQAALSARGKPQMQMVDFGDGEVQPVRAVYDRQSFIDHIQRVEAYANGASLADVQAEVLPERLRDESVAAYAGSISDATRGRSELDLAPGCYALTIDMEDGELVAMSPLKSDKGA
ncbi:MAG: hypothetical protein AAF513_17360 [Pseudomonadota bacterium]